MQDARHTSIHTPAGTIHSDRRDQIQNYWRILRAMTASDFKLRYHGSVLGVFWSFIRPLAMFSVLYIVFAHVLHLTAPHYILSLLVGLLMWNFFAEATSASVMSIALKILLVRKLAFPKSIIVLSAVLTALMTLLIGLMIAATCILVGGTGYHASMVAFPFLLGLFFIFTVGVSLIIAALSVGSRDIRFMWEMILQMLFWATPIAYTASMVSVLSQWFLFANPLGRFIEYARMMLLDGRLPSLHGMAYITCFSLCAGAAGWLLFSSQERRFAERL